ncbi:MAG: electron transfer flavoprotein subunit alpha/FixB family protein [Polyangia bacterium]
MGNVLAVAQILDGEVKKATHSTVACAAEIASSLGGSYSVLALGDDLGNAAKDLQSLGAEKVLLAEAAGLDNAVAEQWTPIIEKAMRDGGFQVLVGPASSTCKDVFPRVAYRLEAGMASEVVALSSEGGSLRYVRPMFAGNVNGTIEVTTEIQVLTIRPSEFDPVEPGDGQSPSEKIEVPPPLEAGQRVKFVKLEKAESARPDLSEAGVVVSGGRGLKSKENFELVENLADLFGGAVGATRAAVDAGLIHNEFQVGQTGKIVAPDLYFGIGLSGALQHVAGMKSSKVVVAINKDEEAPIFQVSDYGLVADLFKVVPDLIEQIKKVAK